MFIYSTNTENCYLHKRPSKDQKQLISLKERREREGGRGRERERAGAGSVFFVCFRFVSSFFPGGREIYDSFLLLLSECLLFKLLHTPRNKLEYYGQIIIHERPDID